MKFATIIENGQHIAGIISDNQFYSFKSIKESDSELTNLPEDLIGMIKDSEKWLPIIQQWEEKAKKSSGKELEQLNWAPPIPRPLKNIFCVGKNYAAHASEVDGSAPPEHMIVFTKAPTTVSGHGQAVPLHEKITNELDYEGELAIVIGKGGKSIPREEAFQAVFGYTILNDITARDLQAKHKQYFLGKSLDGTCPIGPWIVSKEEIANPADLEIETKVNGETRQHARTSQFLFPIEEMISTISNGITLEPGDIIATGTPAGVGKGYKPPRFLKKGDQIEVTIESIGSLHSTIHGE